FSLISLSDFNTVRLHSADGLRPPIEFENLDEVAQCAIQARVRDRRQAGAARRAAARRKNDEKEAACAAAV
ncbi:hypothetical protein, partial [Sphaerimonospora thailandensis]|uniref:hypothetical protein n=1 Tax=Sphaerimonospora thailandensis TaxID=795644 RepID=UPI0019513E43